MSDPSWASPGDQSEPPPAAPTGPPVPEGMPDIRPPAPQPGYGPAVSPQPGYGPAVSPQPGYGPVVSPQPGYGPVVSAPPPGDGPQSATPMYYAMPDPQQNWGLNPNSGVRYQVLVPRPPRPTTVTLGLLLTYVGVGVAMVYLVIDLVTQWADRDRLIADAARGAQPSDVDTTALVRNSIGLVLVVVGVLWVLIAAGLVICAALANRGRNGARITLASIMGVLGLYQLCSAVSAGVVKAVATSGDQSSDSPFSAFNASSANIHWWSYVGSSLLAVIALIVFVLLIVPPTNRYFSAGPGRRFGPGA